MTCLCRPHQTVPGSMCLVVSGVCLVCAWYCYCCCCCCCRRRRRCCCYGGLSAVEPRIVGIGGYPPGVSSFQRLDAIPPIIVATCVSFLDHAPFLANETEAETCAPSIYQVATCLLVYQHAALNPPFFLHAPTKTP